MEPKSYFQKSLFREENINPGDQQGTTITYGGMNPDDFFQFVRNQFQIDLNNHQALDEKLSQEYGRIGTFSSATASQMLTVEGA